MTNLSNVSDEHLLMELLRRNNYADAPSRVVRSGRYYEAEVDIGEYHSASIIISEEDLAALRDSML